MPHVLNFTGCDLFGQKFEYYRNDIRNEWNGIVPEGVSDTRDEVGFLAMFDWRRVGPPVLVIDPAQKLWELCAKTYCLIDRKPIAQGLQYSSQQAVRTVLIPPSKPRIEVIDPNGVNWTV